VARAFLVALVASATELTKRKKRGFGEEFILPRFAYGQPQHHQSENKRLRG